MSAMSGGGRTGPPPPVIVGSSAATSSTNPHLHMSQHNLNNEYEVDLEKPRLSNHKHKPSTDELFAATYGK